MLQYVQHNPKNNKQPMPDILSGGGPPPDAQIELEQLER